MSEETTAVAEYVDAEVQAVREYTSRPLVFKKTLEIQQEQRKLIKAYVESNMQRDVDYGVIPGTAKPTLYKPGAEKLCDLFRCVAKFEHEKVIEDFSAEKPLFFYRLRCRIYSHDSERLVAEGVGSANSMEGRYRWRNADRLCPKCGKATILRSKFSDRNAPGSEPGWYCYGKKGGCGSNFAADDKTIVGQVQGRVENDDIFTVANTVLKMAKKRALVDATLGLARCSDIFTQDVEDFQDAGERATTDELNPTPPPSNEFRRAPAGALGKKEQEEILNLLHDLNQDWLQGKQRISQIVGRTIAENDHVSSLSLGEYQTLRSHLLAAIEKKKSRKRS